MTFPHLVWVFLLIQVSPGFGRSIGLESIKTEELSKDNKLNKEEKNSVLAFLNNEIEDMEKISQTLEFLEGNLGELGIIYSAKNETLGNINIFLKADEIQLKYFEDNLMYIKDYIEKAKYKFDNQSIELLTSLIRKADNFLENVKTDVNDVKQVEEKLIIDKDVDENTSNENIRKSLIERLTEGNWPGYPVAREQGARLLINPPHTGDRLAGRHKYHIVNNYSKETKEDVIDYSTNVNKHELKEAALEVIVQNAVQEDYADHLSDNVKEAIADYDVVNQSMINEEILLNHIYTQEEMSIFNILVMCVLVVMIVLLAVFLLRTRQGTGQQRKLDKMNHRGEKEKTAVQMEGQSQGWNSTRQNINDQWKLK